MKSGKLRHEVRVYIASQLASFQSPSDVALAVKEKFGVDISRQAVERYDPHKRAGHQLSQRLRQVFAEAREQYQQSLETIPIAHRTYRMEQLQRAHNKAVGQGDIALLLKIQAQAAKEMGGLLERPGRGGQHTNVTINISGLSGEKRLTIEGQAALPAVRTLTRRE